MVSKDKFTIINKFFKLAILVRLALSDATCSNPRIDHTLTPGATGKDIAQATYYKVWRKISEIDDLVFQDREFLIPLRSCKNELRCEFFLWSNLGNR